MAVRPNKRGCWHKEVAATLPAYFARAILPTVARPGLRYASARLRQSHEILGGSDTMTLPGS